MDLLKTLLVYMTLILSTGTGADPAVTPLTPGNIPTPTPYVTMAPTAVPVVTAAPTREAYATLSMGDRGDAVTRLQLRLRELGYLSQNSTIDGIFGTQTRTAVRNFQRDRGLTVDGVAGPRTQELLFASVPPSAASVLVSYVDQNGNILRQITREMSSSGTIFADTSLLGGSWRITGATSYQITVSGGAAMPSSVVFSCAPTATSVPTAAPTAVPAAVTVPVRYVDQSGRVLYTDNSVQLYRSGTVYANSSRVPAGYTLVSGASQYVIINNGTATPSYVTFTYAAPVTQAPTAAPAVQAYVTVRYCDVNGLLLSSDIISLTSSGTVYARSGMVPSGYTLNGTGSAYVIVNNGVANPSTVTFYYRNTATAVPTATAAPMAYVTVYYQDQYGAILNTDRVALTKSSYVYANSAMVPAGYTLTSSDKAWVRYNSGNPNPSSVTFTYRGSSTATPAPQVRVPVYYQDQNGNILATDIAVMTKSGYVSANDALVPGYTRTSSYRTYVTVLNGTWSPSAVTFIYARNATPTPTAVPQAQVRVYYVDQNGRALYTDYETVTSSRYIYAKDSLVPGYTRTSSSYAYVSFTNGVASPSTVTFSYRQNATATPTAVPQAQVAVYYQDQNGRILATEVVAMTGTAYIYAKDSLVPSNYSRTSAYRVYVNVVNGIASPSSVTFTYKDNSTPTPAPKVNVTVYYQDTQGHILATEVQTLRESAYVYARDELVPASYSRVSDSRTYVTVTNGRANPASVTFTYSYNATATPLPQVSVTVYYADEYGAVLNTEVVVLNASGYVYAKDSLVPAWYARISADSSYVTITNGKANPASVTFTYRNTSTPTPAPKVNVTVYYQDTLGGILTTDTVALSASGYVYADSSKVPAGYTLRGEGSVYVTVTNGRANPASVTFTYAPPATATPTAVPQVSVQVYYQDRDGGLLNSAQIVLSASGYVYADNSMVPASYELVSDSRVYVTVENGKASPASVTFVYRNAATPEPQPETVYVSVVYRDQNGGYLNSTQVMITGGGYVYADNSMVPAGYVLTGSDSVWVSIENHAPNPAEVVFVYRDSTTPEPTVPGPTPDPGPVGPLTKMGTVFLNGKATKVEWYADSNGRALVNFYDLLIAMEQNMYNQKSGRKDEARARLDGFDIILRFGKDSVTSFTVNKTEQSQGENPAVYPVITDSKPYMPFEFFRQIVGYDYSIDGSTLNMNY